MMKELGRAVVSADGGCASQRPWCNQPRTKILNATSMGKAGDTREGRKCQGACLPGRKRGVIFVKTKIQERETECKKLKQNIIEAQVFQEKN